MSVRVNDSLGARELFTLLVVIGDHKAKSKLVDMFCLADCCNAVIDRNDKLYAICGNSVDSTVIQSVTLGSLRNIICNISACFKQIRVENNGSHNSVAVVIAVNAYALAAVDSRIYGVRSLFHVFDEKRVGKLADIEALYYRIR